MNGKDKDGVNEREVTMGGHDKSWKVIGYWGMCRRGVDRVNGGHDGLCCVMAQGGGGQRWVVV